MPLASESNWERTGKIISETFRLAGKDRDLYWPPILNAIASVVLFGLAVVMFVAGSSLRWGGGHGLLYLAGALLILAAYVASAFFGAALSWMTLEAARGKDTHLGSGLSRAFGKSGSLVAYAVVSFLVGLIVGQIRRSGRRSGLIAMLLKGIFASVIENAWDIAGHFMLPAIALTDKGFAQAAREIPVLLKHLPQALVGGFAFDFVVGWVYALEAILCFLLFLAIGLWAVLAFLLLALLTHIFYSFVKSVYFTMLYLDLHSELKKRRA